MTTSKSSEAQICLTKKFSYESYASDPKNLPIKLKSLYATEAGHIDRLTQKVFKKMHISQKIFTRNFKSLPHPDGLAKCVDVIFLGNMHSNN